MTTASLDEFLMDMRAMHRAPEADVLRGLIPHARVTDEERARIEDKALGLLADIRRAERDSWIATFLHEYRLNTDEGVALLALAEAFLRVPDQQTRDLLIADKVGDADWGAHRAKSPSALVNSATWGLVVTKALVGDEAKKTALTRLINRTSEPFVRQAVAAAMKVMGRVFVMGQTIDQALERMEEPKHKGFTASFDMLGEAARTYEDAERYFEAYERAIDRIGKSNRKLEHSISVKLSALHPRYETTHAEACVPALIDMVGQLAKRAAKNDIFMTIDAEESDRMKISLDVIEAVARHPGVSDWNGFGMVVQAYSKRARAAIGWADTLGAETGQQIGIRLVKGAYWDTEIKLTQQLGLEGYPLYTRKPATDVSYLACAKAMLQARNLRPAFASHNALTVSTILEWAGDRRDYEFQRLHGMGEGLYERLVREEGHSCRIYAPVGGHSDLLAYLVRRLLENGANSSFVHQLADENIPVSDLLADPVEKIEQVNCTPHPAIPLPVEVFEPARKNSFGIDLEDSVDLASLEEDVRAYQMPDAPADATAEDVTRMVDQAHAASLAWADTPVEVRAELLERMADKMQERMIPLIGLCVHEAKKTYQDAIDEVREAIDFCRYYARRARIDFEEIPLPGPTGETNVMRLGGRGVFACVAPWNFPLAIFTGQMTAALVAGNTVVAKPAPQTPRIAQAAVDIAHEVGVPKDVLHIAPGGAEPGAALTGDRRVAGIAFTGSTATAKRIQRTVAEDDDRPIVPLIAETGGLNAMFVDSTALPEQAVMDIIASAFFSAGQRCSALRLLLIQEDVYDRTMRMLTGAMDTMNVGDPADPATDIGPVIDAASQEKLCGHIDHMRQRIVHQIKVPDFDTFVPPTVIRLDEIEDLEREWFGPVLHVTTWKQGKLEETVRRVNALGYGLTMGLHSRIADAAEEVAEEARVGNLYVNRTMTGAIVGSQPFGGERMSGTGPKAGGPHYLPRFAVERVVTVDTTSAGGNASLLSIDAT
ncbi:delta-1-pyrroline-5-carboxylate dehydrogenase [Pacificimonas flava]|uniref:Bifunctional protein PutA n=2 Tax=Pacificimonas TaxID=1960290 RepID=A0A219B817_9SPHN|nr:MULTISPECIES: L-glutamate gamma-semialdehyde dehydrogenase [Pacificimonas]MBZ6378394.1 L-glutamate gamma-semialdehyde dehydrogenase [Pacificimonas aurantium]OWV34303.1 delta-1-pyrroline-5-carboxylate dehydrogenase [Pacificimonas flava]